MPERCSVDLHLSLWLSAQVNRGYSAGASLATWAYHEVMVGHLVTVSAMAPLLLRSAHAGQAASRGKAGRQQALQVQGLADYPATQVLVWSSRKLMKIAE